jgi:hypothetical protein
MLKSIIVGNSKSMMAAKAKTLKSRVIHVDGSRLDITLHIVKFVPKSLGQFVQY